MKILQNRSYNFILFFFFIVDEVNIGAPHIPYEELEIATNFWDKSKILGRGGFGVVFKGTWKNTAVAIKRLETQVNVFYKL